MCIMKLTAFESTMLDGWGLTYNKAQLSLWIMVAIRQKKEFADEISYFIKKYARLEPENQSLYRYLRRLESATLVESVLVPSVGGPDKKRFSITNTGENLLNAFIERNIYNIIIQGEKKVFLPLERRKHKYAGTN